MILAYLSQRLASKEDAEDLCQETFARVMKTPSAPREGFRLRPYLFQTASNLLSNHHRRLGLVRVESELGTNADLASVADPARPSPEAQDHLRKLTEQLQVLLGELPTDQRMAFELGVLGGQPYAAIAAETGWSLSKVKVTVFRARKRLIEGLKGFLPEG